MMQDTQENSRFRPKLIRIAQTALAAVHPKGSLDDELRVSGNWIEAGELGRPLRIPAEKIAVVALGKATAAMADEARRILGDRIVSGIAVVRDLPDQKIPGFEVVQGGHPDPNELSENACAKVEAFVDQWSKRSVSFLVLLSGGASALVAAPVSGISRADLVLANNWLLESGHNIRVVNLVRRKITRLGAGGLLERIGDLPCLTLAISDVVHGAPEDIGSGPTLPDPATNEIALRVIAPKGRLAPGFPESIYRYLQKGAKGEAPQKPDRKSPLFKNASFVIVRDILVARKVAVQAAMDEGFATVRDNGVITGEAKDFGMRIGKILQTLHKRRPVDAFPVALIYGGESTVTIEGACGKGGRNQELALAVADAAGPDLPFDFTVLSFGTDGSDGPTDAAGAFVDATTLQRARAAGLDIKTHLEQHNAYPFFQKLDDLFITGPTGTNVADLILVAIDGPYIDRQKSE
jgi:glycerate-2-kinase